MPSLYLVLWAVLTVTDVSTIYNIQNASRMFDYYKDRYHRVYGNVILENRAKANFVTNLNKVDALNEKNLGSDKIYVLNKYADIDQENFEEHYGLNITPYDISTIHREFPLPAGGLRNHIEPKPEAKSVEHIDLYDLDDADNLYKEYMKKFNKQNATKSYDQTVHYYRFIKTLVEMNRNHYKGISKQLDENSDVVKRPYDYFY